MNLFATNRNPWVTTPAQWLFWIKLVLVIVYLFVGPAYQRMAESHLQAPLASFWLLVVLSIVDTGGLFLASINVRALGEAMLVLAGTVLLVLLLRRGDNPLTSIAVCYWDFFCAGCVGARVGNQKPEE